MNFVTAMFGWTKVDISAPVWNRREAVTPQ